MDNPNNAPVTTVNPKAKTYVVGLGAGLIFGLLSAYLFERASQEAQNETGSRPQISALQLVSLSLAALGLVRQITTLGQSKGKK